MIDTVQESFFPGEKWVSYEIYIGIQSANKFLSDYFFPIATELKSLQIITKWYFLRYSDPEFHLRLRFEINDESGFQKVVSAMNTCFMKQYCKEMIWDIKLTTYHRELERYGKQTIGLAEEIFWLDSQVVLSILKQPHYKFVGFEWKAAISMMLYYLEGFYDNLRDRLFFIEKVRGAYENEFQLNKQTRVSMAKNYRTFKHEIDDLLDNFQFPSSMSTKLEVLNKNLKKYNEKNCDKDLKEQILSSLIHMSHNRLFVNKNREQEFLCYDFLFKILKTRNAKRLNLNEKDL